ncbi:cytochrome oxidase assembly protein ShyY1 [Nakamurella sp. UYEF19]|uniref:SURF1 family cytochrome oxidase biogenesis protein n=1 Tax=Nakamurella sp. UYEF19 TaxID=1756392 RepID=UPI003398BAC4
MTATIEKGSAAAPRPARFRFLLKPGWLGAVVAALAFTAACWMVLAPWQFSRNAENTATNNSIRTALTATPVAVRQLLSTTTQPDDEAVYKPVTATGTFDPQNTYYVRLRQDSQGNPVSEVVLPMRLTDGTVLLVDRGYRSFGDIKANVPLPPVPSGQVTVTGRVQQDQTDPAGRTPKLQDGLNQAWAVDADSLAGMVGTTGPDGNILQGYIQLEAGSPGVLVEIGLPQTDVGPYFSYALQWCAFGGMSLLAICYFIFREATDPRGPDERNVSYPDRSRYPDEISPPPGNLEPAAVLPRPDPDGLPEQSSADARPAPAAPAAARATAGLETAGSQRAAPEKNSRRGKTKRPARDGFDRSQLFD